MLFQMLREWLAWHMARRKWRRRRRDIGALLVLVLMCVLCQVFGLACGVVGYAMQWLGMSSDDVTSPVLDAKLDQARYPPDADGLFSGGVLILCKLAVMV